MKWYLRESRVIFYFFLYEKASPYFRTDFFSALINQGFFEKSIRVKKTRSRSIAFKFAFKFPQFSYFKTTCIQLSLFMLIKKTSKKLFPFQIAYSQAMLSDQVPPNNRILFGPLRWCLQSASTLPVSCIMLSESCTTLTKSDAARIATSPVCPYGKGA